MAKHFVFTTGEKAILSVICLIAFNLTDNLPLKVLYFATALVWIGLILFDYLLDREEKREKGKVIVDAKEN